MTSTPTVDLRAPLLAEVPLEERFLDLAGIHTAIWEGGHGAPMVLLHGPGEFAAVWNRVIPDLAATNRVVVPDLPGHGATGIGDGVLDRERLAAWLGELIERTCGSAPVLVGHLLGGAIAARHVIERPDRVAGLVLVDSFGLAPFRPTFGFGLAMVTFVARPTERSQRGLMNACMDDLDGMRREMDGGLERLEAYALDRARNPLLKKAMSGLMPAFAMRAIPSDELGRISVPTTLIHGRNDRQVKLAAAERASERYGWPLHVIDDCGDDPAAEQPAAFLRALRSALPH